MAAALIRPLLAEESPTIMFLLDERVRFGIVPHNGYFFFSQYDVKTFFFVG